MEHNSRSYYKTVILISKWLIATNYERVFYIGVYATQITHHLNEFGNKVQLGIIEP